MDCLPRRRAFAALTLGSALALAAPLPAAAIDLHVTGADGADGVGGTPAIPDGGPGVEGAAASAAVSSADADNTAHATGGTGGAGGTGFGAGTGGAGGQGGGASATVETIAPGSATSVTSAIAVGGAGGQGGAGGVDSGGGDGGVASASASAIGGGAVTVSGAATGGAGGAAGCCGNGPAMGGAAGVAYLGPVTGTSTGGGTVTVTGVQVGGAGGESDLYDPIQPAGADSVVTDKVSGETTGTLILRQDAYGGLGGGKTDYKGSLGGKGGDAASSLTNTSSSANVIGSAFAIAGNGGRGYAGGTGGSATASISLQAPGDVHASASAFGGGPGQFWGAADLSTPGYGGGASLGSVFGASTGGGAVTVSGSARAGDASGLGVSLSNVVDGETSGDLTLSQSAIGGSSWSRYGENGSFPLFGGSGYSALIKTDADFQTLPSSLTLDVVAQGGKGNYGGKGGSGFGGSATAIADALLSTTPVVARAIAVGGDYVGEVTYLDYYVTGGSASASARSNTQAEALAFGGDFDASATADASAIGSGLRAVSARALAETSPGIGRVFDTGPSNGKSVAHASNTSGQAAEAISGASGQNASSKATSSTTSNQSVSLIAAAGDMTLAFNEGFHERYGPSGTINAEARTAVGSLADVGAPAPYTGNTAASAVGQPNAAFLTSHLAGSPTVAARFDFADTNAVSGWGRLNASSFSSDWMQYADGVSRLDFTIETAMFLAQGGTAGRLLVGLFNPFLSKQAGSDQLIRFDILEDGVSVLPGGEASFTGSAGIESYFGDKVLDLGAWQEASWFSPGESTLNFSFVLAASGGRPEGYPSSFASFSTELVFGLSGRAVPEPVPLPAAFWLFGSGAAAVLALARRRRVDETEFV